MIGDALMDSLGGALGGSSGAGTLPPPRAKVSRGGGAPSAGGFGAELVHVAVLMELGFLPGSEKLAELGIGYSAVVTV